MIKNSLDAWKDSNVKLIVECSCGSLEDLLILEYWDDPDEWKFYNDMGFNQLLDGETFFQRLWHGLRHAFNGKKKWTGFNSTLVSYEETKRIIKFLQGFIDKQDEVIKEINDNGGYRINKDRGRK